MNLNRLYTEIILVSVLLLTACHKTAPVLYRIPLSEGIEHAALFDAGDYIDSVLLETNDSCWIGDVYKIIPYRNFYYIRDLHENLFFVYGPGKISPQDREKRERAGRIHNIYRFCGRSRERGCVFSCFGKIDGLFHGREITPRGRNSL